MTFGLRNAAQTFQRYADTALGDLPFAFVYIDNILIASPSLESHKKHLETVLDRLKKYALQLNLEKCNFAKQQLQYLGYIINEEGYRPLPEKVEAIKNYPKPSNVDELRRFLGLIHFYRQSIPHAAHSQYHLNKYLRFAKKKDKTPLVWDKKAEEAFLECKLKVANAALLNFPDGKSELRLVTDASDTAMEGVLEQKKDNRWTPLGFFSRKFEPSQQKYTTYDRELMAIVETVKHFKHHLEHRQFEVCTDHKPIIYSQSLTHDKAPAHRVRKIAYLSEFNIKYTHLKGEQNNVADALSRINKLNISQVGEKENSVKHEIYQINSISQQNSILFPSHFDATILSDNQKEDEQLKQILKDKANHPLKLHKIKCSSGKLVYCNINNKNIRPYIPVKMRRQIIEMFHAQSHPSTRVTLRLVSQNYVWPNMTKDIAQYCRTCLACQTAKISRNNKTIPAQFNFPDARFQHVHRNLVGLLPESNGYKYLLTMIDRFTRWPEAVPLYETSAKACARAFIKTWISRFGAPAVITTDQGK